MLTLKIDGNQSAGDFRKDFNTAFPFLKIDFYKQAQSKKDSAKLTAVPAGSTLGEASEPFEFNGDTTVRQLKELVLSKLGIITVVFRKSGNIWVEISLTDDWSLDKQNHEAEQMN